MSLISKRRPDGRNNRAESAGHPAVALASGSQVPPRRCRWTWRTSAFAPSPSRSTTAPAS